MSQPRSMSALDSEILPRLESASAAIERRQDVRILLAVASGSRA